MIRNIFICLIVCSSMLWASSDQAEEQKREEIRNEAIQEAIEKEKKYAQEQAFYEEDEYDFESEKVNEESLPFVPKLKPDDLNMDDVYD